MKKKDGFRESVQFYQLETLAIIAVVNERARKVNKEAKTERQKSVMRPIKPGCGWISKKTLSTSNGGSSC